MFKGYVNLNKFIKKVNNRKQIDKAFQLPGSSDNKASAYSVEDLGLIPGLGRSAGEGNGNPLQYSCLENSMDRGAWWATVHGVAKESDMTEQLSLIFHK